MPRRGRFETCPYNNTISYNNFTSAAIIAIAAA